MELTCRRGGTAPDHEDTISKNGAPPIERLMRPVQAFTKLEAAGGVLFVACTIVALVGQLALGRELLSPVAHQRDVSFRQRAAF